MGVKWGVMGTAGIAKGCTIPGMKKAEGCDLYAIAGRNEEKIRSYKEEFGFEKSYTGYEALLADPEVEAVYIPLPNNLHKEWVIKALNAGKHVLCEKPLGLDADEVRQMHETARANNVILMEAYAYLHSPYIEALKADIESGIIGEVQYISSSFLTQGYEDDIRIRRENGGGALYDLGCYCTTLILSLVDSEPVWVRADAEFNDNNVDIFTSGLIKFGNGVRASFNVGMMLGTRGTTGDARYDDLYVHGTLGYIRSSVEFNQEGRLEYTIVSEGKELRRSVEARQNYSLEIEQLNSCIVNEEEPLVTEEFSVRNASLMDALKKDMGYSS